MADQGVKMWLMLIVMVMVGAVTGQRTENCDMTASPEAPNVMVDVHCNCMQRLAQMDLKISKLTINQTGCSQTGLELNWPDLESMVAPRTLVLEGAEVFFARRSRPATPWTPSIKSVIFLRCHLQVLPSHAFRGMKYLEEIRFEGGSIGIVKSTAFSALPELKKVEIENATVNLIESRAFTDLPAFKDLFIVHSTLKEVETQAVSLSKPSQDGETTRCPDVNHNSLDNGSVMDEVIGRELTTVGNLSLPEYGNRVLLFKNNIEIMSPAAIKADTFGFLVVGGNYIGRLATEAFNMQLYSECEISAALFVGNIFGRLDSSALAGLRGRDGMAYQTFIALSNNTFLSVLQQGFMLHPSMVIFSVEENRFACTCGKFEWILGNDEATDLQRDLEKELALEGLCLDGTKLVSFTSSCDDESISTNSPTAPTLPPPTPSPSSAPRSSISVVTGVIAMVVRRALH